MFSYSERELHMRIIRLADELEKTLLSPTMFTKDKMHYCRGLIEEFYNDYYYRNLTDKYKQMQLIKVKEMLMDKDVWAEWVGEYLDEFIYSKQPLTVRPRWILLAITAIILLVVALCLK